MKMIFSQKSEMKKDQKNKRHGATGVEAKKSGGWESGWAGSSLDTEKLREHNTQVDEAIK